MEIIILVIEAFITFILTFFSGFGLGTILTPVFAIFFPIDLDIALTGVVHFCNKLFKIALVGKNTDKTVIIRFGIPAIITSFVGTWFLLKLGGLLSGFFGGLSGLQGAIRSAFLVKSGLSKEAYIGTAVILACLIDITRLSVYATCFANADSYFNRIRIGLI
jgi:uncharacterized protein